MGVFLVTTNADGDGRKRFCKACWTSKSPIGFHTPTIGIFYED